MSPAWPLLPGEYASGPRVAETTLRPVRPACLIPNDDEDMAAKFVESQCLAWGGQASFVLPYSRSHGLSEGWRELLEVLDPDGVFALGPLQESVKDGLRDAGRFVYSRDEPAELFIQAGTLVHSVLGSFGQDLKPPESERFVVIPKVSPMVTAHLPLLARYGSLNEEDVERVLENRHQRYRFNLDLSEFVRIEEVDASRASLNLFTGDLQDLLGEEEMEHARTLPHLTVSGLEILGGSNPQRAARSRRRSMVGRRFTAVVVTGDDASVEDFALYWNLRAEHYFARPFPLWMPLGMLEGPEAPSAIEGALRRAQPGVGTAVPVNSDVLIVSASTDATQLRERLSGSYPEAQIGMESFADLFATTCEYRHATEKAPTHFDRGRASIRPPRPAEFEGTLTPGVDHVAYEVGVDGMWLPQSEAMACRLGWMEDHSHDKVSKRGNLRFVKQFNKEFAGTDLLDLRTPDGWTLLSSVFEERGYDATPTAKSKTALAQLALLGGIENLKVIASSKVHGLLKELSLGRGQERAFVSDRKTEALGRFDREWGREAGRDLLRWLIGRRLLFRGAILRCPRCELGRWYEVDRIGETWRCDGCKEDMPIPLHLQSTSWRYKVNELYAHGHDQGTLAPLLTLYAMHLAWGSSSIQGGLGFYPGVELRAKEGADVPFANKEIDLVAMRGSSLVLAECKETTEILSEPDEVASFARQVGDLVVLADHLGAAHLLVTSSTTLPEDKGPLLGEVPAKRSVEISWLDGHHLLDPNFILHPLSHPPVTGERYEKPEGWETDYLDWARRSVTDHIP
jgi:hypothetical protein